MPGVTPYRGEACVVGLGNTANGVFPDLDEYDLGSQAFREAIADCGLDKSAIDGLLVCRVPSYVRMGSVLGLDPRWTMTLPGQGRMAGIGIIEAAAAVASGRANYVALIYTSLGRSRRVKYGGGDGPNLWASWGYTSPGAAHAMMFRRHMALYGTTTRQLAEVSVAFRYHASLNPDAAMRQPITIEDHEASRPVALPLRLLDYCLINDGAVCLIITSEERARDLKRPLVRIAGFGGRDTFKNASLPNFDLDFWHDPIREAGNQSYRMAGVEQRDVGALMCYDNFSPTVLFSLEGLGFCGRGEGGPLVEGGTLRLGGKLPTNTDGGHLSNSYLQGWALNAEAVRQLRRECGDRQVPACKVVQYISTTPCTRSIIYTAR